MNKQKFNAITKGHFFTVTFVKRDGSIRVLNGLDRVKSYIKGTGKPITDGRIVVWDRQVFRDNLKQGMDRFTAGNRAYRSIIPDSILELKVAGKVYK